MVFNVKLVPLDNLQSAAILQSWEPDGNGGLRMPRIKGYSTACADVSDVIMSEGKFAGFMSWIVALALHYYSVAALLLW